MTNASLVVHEFKKSGKKFTYNGDGPITPEIIGDANCIIEASRAENVQPTYELSSGEINLLSTSIEWVSTNQ